jgi:hypothetical protein
MSTHNYSIISDTANAALASVKLADEIAASSILQTLEAINTNGDDISIIFSATLTQEEIATLTALVNAHDGIPYPVEETPQSVHIADENVPVNPTSDLVCEWACIKNFVDNAALAQMSYFERPTDYYIWVEFRNQKMYIPSLAKDTPDCDDFEDNYKALCNKSVAVKTRITTCEEGRRLHDRYITFTTADQDNYDNTDWREADYGDVTYIMKDVNGDTTTTNADAKETWIDWFPPFSYEIVGGSIFVPDTLAGGNDNAWEVHVIAAPDLDAQYGGDIHLIANPRIKWLKGSHFGIDASTNPATTTYDPTYYSSKIRLVVKHPVGAQSEFQFNLKVFK